MKKKTKKIVENANKSVQDAQSAVHGAQEREYATKKRAEADVNSSHVRELQTALFWKAKIDEVKVESHQKMRYQEKRATIILAKDKVTAQKKLRKHAEASEAIVGDAYQNIFQLKNEV